MQAKEIPVTTTDHPQLLPGKPPSPYYTRRVYGQELRQAQRAWLVSVLRVSGIGWKVCNLGVMRISGITCNHLALRHSCMWYLGCDEWRVRLSWDCAVEHRMWPPQVARASQSLVAVSPGDTFQKGAPRE
uniref:Uncharacterized protein n=1 Tax=Macaca fascicularis TaxID=9541 RepID=Q9GM04_MACFA|nr:hypothetical protein [Macaca fascicularis]